MESTNIPIWHGFTISVLRDSYYSQINQLYAIRPYIPQIQSYFYEHFTVPDLEAL